MTSQMRRSPNLVPRRRIPMWLVFVMVALVMGAVLVVYYMLRPLEGPLPEGVSQHYAGIERGLTTDGFPRLGSASAPILVEDFSSYSCPHCRDLHDEQFEALLPEIAAGNIQFVMVPVPHIGIGSGTAARAAFCAGEQGQFWEMHDTLFFWQKEFLTSVFDKRRVRLGAENLGLQMDEFNGCLESPESDAFLDAARSEFNRRGLNGTPSLFLNGEKVTDYREIEELIPPLDAAA